MRSTASQVRQRISAAAARLFAAERFHEVRMDDIAAEAGVSKGTLYRYFKDKEDLYRTLVAEASEQMLSLVEARLAGAVTPLSRLEEIVAAMFDFFDDHVYFFDLLQRVEALDSQGPNIAWSKTRNEIAERIAESTQACQNGGGGFAISPAIGAIMLLGAVRAVLRLGPKPRPKDLARRLVHGYLYGQLGELDAARVGPLR